MLVNQYVAVVHRGQDVVADHFLWKSNPVWQPFFEEHETIAILAGQIQVVRDKDYRDAALITQPA